MLVCRRKSLTNFVGICTKLSKRGHTRQCLSPNSQTAECVRAHYMGTVISNCIRVIWVCRLWSVLPQVQGWRWDGDPQVTGSLQVPYYWENPATKPKWRVPDRQRLTDSTLSRLINSTLRLFKLERHLIDGTFIKNCASIHHNPKWEKCFRWYLQVLNVLDHVLKTIRTTFLWIPSYQ